MNTVFRYQFGHLLRSLQTWLVIALAAVATGYLFLSQLEFWLASQSAIAARDHAPGLTGFLGVRYLQPLCLLFSLLAPLFAMRGFSEEFRNESHVLWQLAPLPTRSIVLGKFAGVLLVLLAGPVLISVALLLLLPLCTDIRLEGSVIVSAALGIVACTAACTAIGLFFSSLTRHAIVAVIAAMVLILLLWFTGSASFADLPLDWLRMLSLPEHLSGFFQGQLESRGMVYFLTLTTLFLVLTVIRLDALRVSGY